jgi:ABC-type transport system involved in multi-copper enzyme maturation permease subunit
MTALHAEWTKLRTVRSTPWSLALVALVTVGLGAFICSVNSNEGHTGSPDTDLVALSLSGAYFGQLAAAALGVFAIAAEHSTGTIRATLAANPRRGQVLGAKIALVGGLVLVAGLIATVIAFVVGQPILRANGFSALNGFPVNTLADADALRAVANVAVYLALIALLSLGAGAIVRHSAGAMAIVFTLLFGPFIVAAMLPEDAWTKMMGAVPTAGLSGQEQGAPSSPWMGLAVTGAWAAGTLLIALLALRRRDA